MADDPFIDFYELMQINPHAEAETIHRVYHMLEARYHPDNPRTGDPERFLKLSQAYRVLSDRQARAAYDLRYQAQNARAIGIFESREFSAGVEGEANRRMGVLCLLYNRRRSCPDNAGLSILELEQLMGFPREHLIFPLWYLRDMDLLRQDERTNYVITGRGADHLEKNITAYPSLHEFIKASETGVVERSRTEFVVEEMPVAKSRP